MTRRRIAVVLLAALSIATGSAWADIAFPARLDVIEQEPGVFEISFTLPIVEGRKLRAEPRMPPICVDVSPREVGMSSGGYTSTWSVRCEPASLAGEAILVEGLLGTQTDLAFTLALRDGRSYSRILRPSRPGFLVPEKPSRLALAGDAVISGVRRTLRHLSLWLLVAVAALLGQRPRELVVAASAFAGGHVLAQWLGGQGWLEVTTQTRDILVWVTVAVPAIRLAGGDRWRDWLRPLWPTALLLGLLFGGAQPEALPTEGLSNAEQLLALALVAIGVGLAVLLMAAAAVELRAVLELTGGGRWRERAQQLAGYLAGAIAVGMVLALLVGVAIAPGGGGRASIEFALLAIMLGPVVVLIGHKGLHSVAVFLALVVIGMTAGLFQISLPLASLLTLGSLLVLGGLLAVQRRLSSRSILAMTVMAVSAHAWSTTLWIVNNVSRSTAVTVGTMLVAVCLFYASFCASRHLSAGESTLAVRALGAVVVLIAVLWRLTEYRSWFEREVATEAALGLARLPLLSLGLLVVAVVVWMRSRRIEGRVEHSGLHRLAFLGAFLLLPYGTLAVPNPFFAAYAPHGDAARLIMSKVLSETYQALNIEDEEELYDALAESVTGDLVGDLYLDNRRRLTAGTRQGTEVTIRGVSVRDIGEPTEVGAADGGYSYDCQWAVVARVQHLQHVHHRQQIYSGVLTLRAEEGRWKIAAVELHSEDRVVLPWEPT